jgi:hypothetical protein
VEWSPNPKNHHDWAAYLPQALPGSPAWPTNPFLMGFGVRRFLADNMYDLWIVKKPGGGRGAVYTEGADHWDERMRKINLLGVREPRRRKVFSKLHEEIMDYVPWLLVLNFKDIYVLNDRVD